MLSDPGRRRDYDRLTNALVDEPVPHRSAAPPPPDPGTGEAPQRPTPTPYVRSTRAQRTLLPTRYRRILLGLGVVALLGFTGRTVLRARQVVKRENVVYVDPSPKLSRDDEMTIRMACTRYQTVGDSAKYQSCRDEMIKLATSNEAPSFEGVPQTRIMAIKVACDEHQMRGDLLAHRSCVKAKIAEVR